MEEQTGWEEEVERERLGKTQRRNTSQGGSEDVKKWKFRENE